MVLICARSPRSSSVAYFLGYLKILFTVNPFLKILSAPLPKVLSQLSSHSSPSWCADRVVSLPFQSSLHYCCNPDSTACSSWCSPHLKANTSPFHQLSLPWRSQFPCTGSAGTRHRPRCPSEQSGGCTKPQLLCPRAPTPSAPTSATSHFTLLTTSLQGLNKENFSRCPDVERWGSACGSLPVVPVEKAGQRTGDRDF